MKYRIRHITTYEYVEKVSLSQNQARLIPLHNKRQQCLSHHIRIDPGADYLQEYRDYFGNLVTVFEVPELHQQMVVTSESEVEVLPAPQHSFFDDQLSWEVVRNMLARPKTIEQVRAAEFSLPTLVTPLQPDIRAYAEESFTPDRPIIGACEELMTRIFNDFAFDPGFSTINTPVAEVFAHRKGVCQDFAHFALTCLRNLGLAARYMSGYIETLPPPGQEKLVGADASHAWFSVYVPELGWLEFDPTNDQVPQEQHVTLACGRDFNDVTPLKGIMFGGGAHQLSVSVDMQRLPA